MVATLTGDIVKSQNLKDPQLYIGALSSIFNRLNLNYEFFGGDSFQIELAEPENSFALALQIKAHLIEKGQIKTRIAIGIGEITFQGDSLLTRQGSAYLRSGRLLEKIKNSKQNLAIRTGDEKFDSEINIGFKLCEIPISQWTKNTAEIVSLLCTYPDLNQEQLGKKIGIKQNTVSERIKRSHWGVLKEFDTLFKEKVKALNL
ncbi:SatD family protein [Mesonia sp. HuA40]|uniref:SatD family protein n=1 Tax=Mesonia sp. HuA40 TaxID=2602761 RepID=UPI0011C949AC|nr:SatD family protein [Mesonia sp. HuA40]TXK74195.1 transcriptional regulator [Mesonia sp. HuA40]